MTLPQAKHLTHRTITETNNQNKKTNENKYQLAVIIILKRRFECCSGVQETKVTNEEEPLSPVTRAGSIVSGLAAWASAAVKHGVYLKKELWPEV